MSNPMSDEEAIEWCSKIFHDLPPFSITIREPQDALFLSSACMILITNCDKNEGSTLLRNMGLLARQTSVDEAVDYTFNKADECGHQIPKFVRPLLKLMLQHLFDKEAKIKGESDSDNTDKD